MKILSLSTLPLLPHLGSGKTRLNWAFGLRKLGHDVDVLEPKHFELFQKIRSAKKYRQAIGLILAVKEKLKENEYDIIEFYGDEYWLLLLWLKKIRKNAPLLIAHVDGIELYDMDKEQSFWNKRNTLRNFFFKSTHYRFSKITFSLAERFVCGCNDDLRYVREKAYFEQEHSVCIAPGIDEDYHGPSYREEKEKIIVFVGSWIKRKGIAIIPDVMKEILTKHPDYRFHIYGAWASANEILNAFDDHIRSEITVFDKLSLEELRANVLKSSIFFFPSYSEGFGLATVEAMCCSCAIVTTPTGIGAELINGKEALVCAYNNVLGMIDAIDSLINDEDKRRYISYNGFLKSKQFVWSKQVKKLEKVYMNWIGNRN